MLFSFTSSHITSLSIECVIDTTCSFSLGNRRSILVGVWVRTRKLDL